MPIYEYRVIEPPGCETCSAGFEVQQKMDDARLEACPACGNAVQRIISSVNVVRGWVMGENGFPTGAVAGFGWKDVNVVAAGIQLKLIEKLPIRFGYTYSSNPITEDNVFFSSPAPAVIKHAAQGGFSYLVNDNLGIHLTYHRGIGEDVTGQLMTPQLITAENPLGKIPGTEITSRMHTDVLLLGVSYGFGK